MARWMKSLRGKAGLPPGTLVHVGEKRTEKTKITVLDYGTDSCRQHEVPVPGDVYPYKTTDTVSWINIDGIHDVNIVGTIGREFGIHPLLLEDIVNTSQRAKVNYGEQQVFIVLKMLDFNEAEEQVEVEQVSLVFGPNYLLSFQEREGDVFEGVRERIRSGRGRVRQAGTDYLAYALMDAIVDNYYLILERIGDRVEKLEEEVINDPAPETVRTIYHYKREMINLRRAAWPLREEIGTMMRDEHPQVSQDVRPYLRDLYEHCVQVIDTIETFRDMISGMLDLYLSCVSNRMNEVMKVLTIIATIFIPLSFVVGLYGMNFDPEVSPWNMPELSWYFGYPAVWCVLLAITGAMLYYFKRRGWL
ncbi:MAG: magnesium/cobalt transporter CorA [Phycisphaerae bacterium]